MNPNCLGNNTSTLKMQQVPPDLILVVDNLVSQLNQRLSLELTKNKELEDQLKKQKEILTATEQKFKEELSSLSSSIAKQKEKEIETLHTRVKNTIAKRDETIQSLNEELHILQAKTQQQELLIEKQRTKLHK